MHRHEQAEINRIPLIHRSVMWGFRVVALDILLFTIARLKIVERRHFYYGVRFFFALEQNFMEIYNTEM